MKLRNRHENKTHEAEVSIMLEDGTIYDYDKLSALADTWEIDDSEYKEKKTVEMPSAGLFELTEEVLKRNAQGWRYVGLESKGAGHILTFERFKK